MPFSSLRLRACHTGARSLLLLLATAACAPRSTPAPAPVPVAARIVDGMAQLVPEYADSTRWIRHDLWVETDFDSDNDGRMDRVHVGATRPGQTSEGLKVSVLYSASPYFAGTASVSSGGFWDPRQELDAESPPRAHLDKPRFQAGRRRISNSLVNQWVPRGFAVVHSSQPGTGLSQGCPTIGDYAERAPMKFVVDWLNGRVKGYSTPTGSEEVHATSWSTGKVGMIGTSYEGTLPLAAATSGVQGLEVVVPVAANTSYYHYYRSNGLVRAPGGYQGEDVDVLYDFIASGDTATRAACDRIWKQDVFASGMTRRTGDFNQFWLARDLLPHVHNIRAAVLLAHGLNDYNVMPDHSVRIYDEMRARGLPVSLYLHQGGHGGTPPMDMLNRWFTHYLYGADNGVRDEPPVWIVPDMNTPPEAVPGAGDVAGGISSSATPRARPAPIPARPFASFPVPGSTMVTFRAGAGGNGTGPLMFGAAASAVETLVDNPALSGSAHAAAARSAHRLLYATGVFSDTVHISGSPRVTLRVAANRPAANLSVWLILMPHDSTIVGSASRAGNISLGWADLRNHRSLTPRSNSSGTYASMTPGEPLVPGRFYEVTFDLQPTDEYVPAGRRLGVMIMSSDPEFTLIPKPGTELTVDLARSLFSIPVVGGASAVRAAGGR